MEDTDTIVNIVESFMAFENYISNDVGKELERCKKLGGAFEVITPIVVKHPEILSYMRGDSKTYKFNF